MATGQGKMSDYGPEFPIADRETFLNSPFVVGFEKMTPATIAIMGVADEVDATTVSEMGLDFNDDLQF